MDANYALAASSAFEDKVRLKVRVERIIYPKNGQTSGSWTIAAFRLEEVLEGEIPDCFQLSLRFTAKGSMPALNALDTYTMVAHLVEDAKYGLQYEVDLMCLDYDLTDKDDQLKFFSFFLTPTQTAALYENCDNPLVLLQNHDTKALMKIKGIGPVTAQRMINKYEDSKDLSLAFVRFYDLGLTKGAIEKLVHFYGSPEAAVEVIEKNPYLLIIQVPGYGWAKADAIAMSQGLAHDSDERMGAYLVHYLREQAEMNGNSWVSVEDLCVVIDQVCDPQNDERIYELIRRNIKNHVLYYDKETERVGLMEYRELEQQIANEILRIQRGAAHIEINPERAETIIHSVELEQGFEYTEEQRTAIWNTLNNQFSILTGGAGCVDCDTEFFNGERWKRIADYQPGDKVLQYNPETGSGELVVPERYIKQPCSHLNLVHTKYGIDFCVSDNHVMYYISPKNKIYKNQFANVKEIHSQRIRGFAGRFFTTFSYSGEGITLTDEEIELMCAVICDGHFPSSSNRCRCNLKRKDKQERLQDILRRANIPFTEHCWNRIDKAYRNYMFNAPIRTKVFTKDWYNCTQHQLQVIVDNILYWDGSVRCGRRSFSTTVKENADFVQFAFAACGYRATIATYDRRGQSRGKYVRQSLEYTVTITDRTLVCMGGTHPGHKIPIQDYTPIDGYEYCFTVPSSLWIQRRNDRIMVTGNCGKTSAVNGIAHVLEAHNFRVAQVSLSGRAASKLTEITHIEGRTIHRLLKYDPESGKFSHNKENPLPYDIIIGDEVSMWGGEITLSLLQAIPTGAKVLFIGDTKQLEAIGLASVLTDTIKSHTMPTVQLTKIQRQQADSGIITQSLKVACGEQIVGPKTSGVEYRGVRKDFKLVTYIDSALTQSKIIDEFKELYINQHVSANDIQVLVPMRSRGEASCRALNLAIQEIVNGTPSVDEITVPYTDGNYKYSYTYRPNDRIIIMKNNYKTINIEGNKEPIYNGNVGYIKQIGPDFMIVNLTEQGDIVLGVEDYNNLSLGYAITVHKKQGDSSPYVIGAIDSSSYALMSKELLYTMITRARKYCVLVGQKKILQQAVRISRVKTKQTWLCELLQQATNNKENLHAEQV